MFAAIDRPVESMQSYDVNGIKCVTCQQSWAPAEIFPEGGKVTDTLKSRDVFGAPYRKSTIFRRAEGANENFCFFRDV